MLRTIDDIIGLGATMRFDDLIKSLESFRELLKSKYDGYDPKDNARRKARNVEENVIDGPNKNSKQYTTPGSAMSDQHAKNQAKLNNNPMTTITHPKTGEKMVTTHRKAKNIFKKFKAKASVEKCDYDKNGQWKMKKMDVFSGAGGNIGAGGMPMGAANKSEGKIPDGLADKKLKTVEKPK